MNAYEQRRYDALKRVADFGTNNMAELTAVIPPATGLTPGQAKAKELFLSLSTPETGLLARILENAESQTREKGESEGGTTSKTVRHDALMLDLREVNRTAAAIATAQHRPEIMSQFRMPHGATETELVAEANAMAKAADAMKADFIEYAMPETFVADLRARIAEYQAADSPQNVGEQKSSGATAGFGPLMEEGLRTKTQLEAFVHNFYRSNAARLGEWKTASHIERAAKKKKDGPSTPPAPGA